MSNFIFTATGCTRCKIAKGFMNESGIPFAEKNIKEEGKEDFQKFYSANRKAIYRGPDGIEFPVFTDEVEIHQGIGSVLAYLHSGNKLNGFFSIGTLHKEWVDGIHVSSGNPKYGEEFISVLRYLKGHNMKLQLDTNGLNSHILQQILSEGLADVVIMNVVGSETLYPEVLGETVEIDDIKKSIAIVPQFPKYQFQTMVLPVIRKDGDSQEISYMTPAEIAETARMIEEVTGSKKHPYLIQLFKPEKSSDQRLKAIKPITANMLFPYRTAARSYQVFAEVEKTE